LSYVLLLWRKISQGFTRAQNQLEVTWTLKQLSWTNLNDTTPLVWRIRSLFFNLNPSVTHRVKWFRSTSSLKHTSHGHLHQHQKLNLSVNDCHWPYTIYRSIYSLVVTCVLACVRTRYRGILWSTVCVCVTLRCTVRVFDKRQNKRQRVEGCCQVRVCTLLPPLRSERWGYARSTNSLLVDNSMPD
jgi:hypothetical protein